jgi:hypothetical protein
MNIKFVIARSLIGRGWLQFLFFLIVAAFILLCLGLLGHWIGFKPFDVFMSYIAPGNGWKIVGGQQIKALSGSDIRDWYLPIIGIFGAIIFTGLLVSVFTNIVQYWVGRIRNGHLKYNLKEHIVIIGFDAVVPSLVKQLLTSDDTKKRMIVIASKKPVSEIRGLICSKIEGKKERWSIVYMHSEHLSKRELSRLNTPKAHHIYVVGDRIEGNRDAENMRMMMVLSYIHKKHFSKQIPLTMWFDNETTYAAMQLNDIKKKEWNDWFDFRPYNYYNDWADRLLVSGHYHKGGDRIDYPALDRDGITKDSDKHVHLVIIGMNRMGVAVAKEAAHMLHFPNFEDNGKNQTVITFIDDHADTEMAFFKGRHPGYFEIAPTYYWDAMQQESSFELSLFEKEKSSKNFLDVQFRFIKGRIESNSVKNWLAAQAKDSTQYLTVAVCLSDSINALGAALYLPEELYYNLEGNLVNIFVRQDYTGAFVETLYRAATSGENKRLANLYPFGMIDNSFDLKEQDVTIAKILNYVYDYYYDNGIVPTSVLDKLELEAKWRNKSISIQWSNIYLADSLTFKLRSIGYDINCDLPLEMSNIDKDRMARVEHNRWNMEKLLIGYRALREDELKWSSKEKKEARKTRFIHHDIRPYEDLPSAEQQNDKNIIDALPMVIKYMKVNNLLHCHSGTADKTNKNNEK